MVVIPARSDLNHYDLQVVLDGVAYTLELRWSYREEAWFLDVRTEQGDPIYVGLKVVLDFGLGRRCVDPRFPSGMLIAVDTQGVGGDPGLEDLGDRVQLLYFPESELPIDMDAAFAALGV